MTRQMTLLGSSILFAAALMAYVLSHQEDSNDNSDVSKAGTSASRSLASEKASCLESLRSLRLDNEYIHQVSQDQKKTLKEKKLKTTWTELATETLQWGNLYENYPCHPRHQLIREVYVNDLKIMMEGLEKSKLYEPEDYQLSASVRRAYELVVAKNPQTHAAKSLARVHDYFSQRQFKYPKAPGELKQLNALIEKIVSEI
jgi:hypothetical protein